MKNIAIIPARSGSKGLKDKNIKKISGKPLLAYSIEAAIHSNMFDEIMVSTDSEEYAKIAMEYGAAVPFLRTPETSSDTAGSWDVVKEVLGEYKKIGRCFDTVCLLQPTSPLRTAQDIIDAYDVLNKDNTDAVTSVCETDHSPLWTMVLPKDHSLNEFRKNAANVPRQKLDTYYRINGAVYIRHIIYEPGTVILKDEKEVAYIMNRQSSIDIDTELDFKLAEFLMDSRGRS